VLTVVSNPTGAGDYSVSPEKDKYPADDRVTLTAFPSAGYVFDSWSGQTEGIADLRQNPVTFLVGDDTEDDNREMIANFVSSDLLCTLTTIVTPIGVGSIQLSDPQPDGGYPINTRVTVQAVEKTGYVFVRWTGDLGGTENSRTVLMSEDKAITAMFNPTVTTYCTPSDAGSVSLSPESLIGYAAGTGVTITAAAAKGYRFDAWEGDASGSDKSITVTVDEPKTITARFLEKSSGRWWIWAIVGVACALGVLILVRLVYARMNRAALDQPD
jgi:uncharacterized repeat protein (TIGR02543 family)